MSICGFGFSHAFVLDLMELNIRKCHSGLKACSSKPYKPEKFQKLCFDSHNFFFFTSVATMPIQVRAACTKHVETGFYLKTTERKDLHTLPQSSRKLSKFSLIIDRSFGQGLTGQVRSAVKPDHKVRRCSEACQAEEDELLEQQLPTSCSQTRAPRLYKHVSFCECLTVNYVNDYMTTYTVY